MSQLRADLDHPGFRGVVPAPDSPQRLLLDFIAALNREDLEAATRCFARDACFLTPDATAIRGRDSIRSFLAQLIAAEHRFEADLGTTVIADDVALCRDRLKTVTAASTGAPFEQHSQSTAVLRHRERSWRLQVLAPWETQWRA
jgi:uncharacterized protein (TIGR02246 family)